MAGLKYTIINLDQICTYAQLTWLSHGLFNSIGNNREGCVTKCGASFLNSSSRLTFARSPAKPVLTFVYTSATLQQDISYPKKLTVFHVQRNTQFPKLTTIRCKVSCVEGYVTKYCCYVMLDMIGHVAKYRQTCIRDSTIVFALRNIVL